MKNVHLVQGAVVVIVLASSYFASAQLGGPTGVNIPFNGMLERDGQVVSDDVDITFGVWNAATGGTECYSTGPLTTSVNAGSFSAVIGPVPPACVQGKDLYVEVAVDDGSGAQGLVGRQRVYPSTASVSSGSGDFDVGGNLSVTGTASAPSASITAATMSTANVTTATMSTANVSSALNVTGLSTLSNTGAVSMNGSAGDLVMNDRPIHLRGTNDDNHRLGFASSFGGKSFNGPLLTGYSGGVLGSTDAGDRAVLSWSSDGKVLVDGPGAFGVDVNTLGVTGKIIGMYGNFDDSRGMGVGGAGTSDEVWTSTNNAVSWFVSRTDAATGTKNMLLGSTGFLITRGSVTANGTPDIAETIAAADDVATADIVCADPNGVARVVRCTPGARTPLGVIGDGTSSFLINAHGQGPDAPLTGKPLVLAGRVPVKVTMENGAITPGDALVVSATHPGFAAKSDGRGAIVGIALAAAAPSSPGTAGPRTVLALIKVGDAHAVDAAERIAALTRRLDDERAANDALRARLAKMEQTVARLAAADAERDNRLAARGR